MKLIKFKKLINYILSKFGFRIVKIKFRFPQKNSTNGIFALGYNKDDLNLNIGSGGESYPFFINLDLPSLEFYSEVSEILRKYFQNNYYIISFEMTSSELKKYFQDKELNILLDQIDQVKFGRKDSSYSEKKDILVLLKKVIRKLL